MKLFLCFITMITICSYWIYKQYQKDKKWCEENPTPEDYYQL